jgi:Ca-activated chloride channel homolog
MSELTGSFGRIVIFATLAILVAAAFVSGQVKDRDDPIRIETSLVIVPVSVRTRNGQGIGDLTKDRFRIFEDGTERLIELFEAPGAPITVALVIDMSDSARMSLREMKAASAAFLGHLQPRDRALIVAFDKNINRVLGATSDHDMLRLGLLGIAPGAGTALYDAVEHIFANSFQSIGGRHAVVLLTDGIDTASTRATFESSAAIVAAGNIPVYPIQFEPEDLFRKRFSADNSHVGSTIYTTPSGESLTTAYQRGTRYLRLIAASSGGRFQFADTTRKLELAFAKIAADLRQLYFIGFYPDLALSKPGTRRLKVTTDVPGARVDGRERYTARPQ